MGEGCHFAHWAVGHVDQVSYECFHQECRVLASVLPWRDQRGWIQPQVSLDVIVSVSRRDAKVFMVRAAKIFGLLWLRHVTD